MSERAHVWIVSGTTGSYEDVREWAVVAFTTREEADVLCERLNAWCRANDVHSRDRVWRGGGDLEAEAQRRVALEASAPDPFFQCSDGTTYSVAPSALGAVHRDCPTCRGER